MPGDWIAMRIELADDPAVIDLARAIGVNEDEAVGVLLRVWGWFDLNTPDGNAPSVTVSWLNRFSRHENVAETLIETGWMAETKQGGLRVVHFDTYMGKCGKKRLQGAKRQKRRRAKGATNVTPLSRQSSRKGNAKSNACHASTEQYSSLSSTTHTCAPGGGNTDSEKPGEKPDPEQPFDRFEATPPPNAPPATDPRILPAREPEALRVTPQLNTGEATPNVQIVNLLKEAGVSSSAKRDRIASDPTVTVAHVEQAVAHCRDGTGGPGMVCQMLTDPDWRKVTDARVAEIQAEAGRRAIEATEKRERAERDAATIQERDGTTARWRALSDADMTRCRGRALELWAEKFPSGLSAAPAEFDSDPDAWGLLHPVYAAKAMDELCVIPANTLTLQAEAT